MFMILLKVKGRDLTQSYDKSPYTHRKIRKERDNTKNATKTFDYTTLLEKQQSLTGVVKQVYEPSTFPMTATVV